MSPEAAAAEQVYLQLKADILGGRFAPTTPLNVQRIAGEIGISISPVRDAMERLVGERILAVRPGGGFQMPHINEASALDLYRWHAWLAQGATQARQGVRRGEELLQWLDRIDENDTEGLVAVTAEFFYRIGEGVGNVEHLLAIRSAGDRLHGLRLRESRLGDRKAELRKLVSLAMTGSGPPLRRAIAVYHRRRLRRLSNLITSLYQPIEDDIG